MQHGFYSETQLPQVNKAVGDFVSELIWGEPGQFGPYCSMAVGNTELQAGVIYHNYHHDCGTIEVSCAAKSHRWMTREVISTAISMPFERLGCQAVLARHSAEAKHIRHIWKALGAVEYEIPRLRGKDQPAEIVSVLTDDAWAVSPFNTNAKASVN